MGPIVVMARRPSLHIPVPPEDVQDELGHIQTIARISSFQSEMAGTAVLQGDPPQWMVQVSDIQYQQKADVSCLPQVSFSSVLLYGALARVSNRRHQICADMGS